MTDLIIPENSRNPWAIVHGAYKTPEYQAWADCRDRCSNKNNKRYHRYGGRGIQVCERWKGSFEAFYEDMGSRPSSEHSIDRIDNDGNYEPGNCRWATREEQYANRKGAVRVILHGLEWSIPDLSKVFWIKTEVIRARLKLGWSVEEAVTTPSGRKRRKHCECASP